MLTPPTGGSGSGGGYTTSPRLAKEDLSQDRLLSSLKRDEFGHPVLGGIPLICRIGKGGMGAVYYGIHPRLRVEVAVKILPFHLLEQDPRLADRFVTEARLAASLASEHIVRVLDVDVDQGTHYIEMEYVFGESAGAVLRRSGRLNELQALAIIGAASAGLAAAHEHGIIHRDVKPDNILIPRTKTNELDLVKAKLADLGLAKPEGSPYTMGTTPHVAMGTPGFMAPEQVEDARGAGFPADVFSMGASLYALLNGNAPFVGTSLGQILRDTATKEPEPLPDGIRREVRDIIGRCLQKHPSRRFSDGRQLLRAIEAVSHAAALEMDIRTLLTIPQEEKFGVKPTYPPGQPMQPTSPTQPVQAAMMPPTMPYPMQQQQTPMQPYPMHQTPATYPVQPQPFYPGQQTPPAGYPMHQTPMQPPMLPQTMAPPPGPRKSMLIPILVVILLLVGIGAGIGIPLYLSSKKHQKLVKLRDETKALEKDWTAAGFDTNAEAKAFKKALDDGDAFYTAGKDDDASAQFLIAQTSFKGAMENGRQLSELKKIRQAVDDRIKKFDPVPSEASKSFTKGNECIAASDWTGARTAFADADKAIIAHEAKLAEKLKNEALAAQTDAIAASKKIDELRPAIEARVKELETEIAKINKKMETATEDMMGKLQDQRRPLSSERWEKQDFLDGLTKHVLSAQTKSDAAAKLAVANSQLQEGKHAACIATFKESIHLHNQLNTMADSLRSALSSRTGCLNASSIVFDTLDRLYGNSRPAATGRQRRADEAYDAAVKSFDRGEFAQAVDQWKIAQKDYEDLVVNVPGEVNEIQKAIDGAEPGDVVLVDKGVYTGRVEMREGVILVGEPGAVLRGDGTYNVVTFKGLKTATIYNFTVEHTGTSTAQTRFTCIAVISGYGYIARCMINRSVGHGIWVATGASALISSCDVTECAWDGVSIQGAGTDVMVRYCSVFSNKSSGISFSGNATGTAEGNECYKNAVAGLEVMDKSSPLFKANMCHDNGTWGIDVTRGATPTLESNIVEKNLGCGLHVKDAGSAPIATLNTIKENKDSGVFIEGKAGGRYSFNTIEGNEFAGLAAYGADVAVRIDDNVLKKNKRSGLFLGGGATVVANRNTCDGNGVDGIAVVDAGTTATLDSNLCTGNKQFGISYDGGAGGKASKNTCSGNSCGMQINGSGTAPTLTSNICKTNTLHGIVVRKGAGGTLQSNKCTENTDSGMAIIDSGTNPSVKGNTCSDNKKFGIVWWGGATPSIASDNTATGNGSGQIQGQ